MLAKLIPEDGSEPISLDRDVTVVGRKRDTCDIYLERSSISKLHCLIVKTDGLLFVRDLGSTNGTKVNGQRVTRGALLPGDELSLATTRFRVHLGPDSPEANNNEVTQRIESLPADLDDDDAEEILELEEFPEEIGRSSESDVRFLTD